MPRYRMTIAYDGGAYAGWQMQPGKPTIQSTLQECILHLTGEDVRVHSSGRTDAGVHARAQVIHFDLNRPADTRKLLISMNGNLEDDLRVMKVVRTHSDFHARKDAIRKEYRYFFWDGEVLPPFLRAYRCHWWGGLDHKAMQTAAAYLQGCHDFAAFTANPRREVESTVRNLSRLEVRRKGHEIVIIAVSEGFLYKMVRSLAGFLLRVGTGDVPPEQAKEILESVTRTARVPTAPPQGLFLWQVWYAPGRK